MHNLGAELAHKSMDCVDIFLLPRAKTEVVETDPELNESFARILLVCSGYADRGPAADAIEKTFAPEDRLEAEELQQFLVKWQSRFEITHREHHVSDAIDFHS